MATEPIVIIIIINKSSCHTYGRLDIHIETGADRCYCNCDSESGFCVPGLIVPGERW